MANIIPPRPYSRKGKMIYTLNNNEPKMECIKVRVIIDRNMFRQINGRNKNDKIFFLKVNVLKYTKTNLRKSKWRIKHKKEWHEVADFRVSTSVGNLYAEGNGVCNVEKEVNGKKNRVRKCVRSGRLGKKLADGMDHWLNIVKKYHTKQVEYGSIIYGVGDVIRKKEKKNCSKIKVKISR